jgi:hypothetical protein
MYIIAVSTDETKDLAAIQPTVEPARSSWVMAKWQLAKAKDWSANG